MSLETRIEKLQKQQAAVEQEAAELDLSEFDGEPYDRATYQPKGNGYGMPPRRERKPYDPDNLPPEKRRIYVGQPDANQPETPDVLPLPKPSFLKTPEEENTNGNRT